MYFLNSIFSACSTAQAHHDCLPDALSWFSGVEIDCWWRLPGVCFARTCLVFVPPPRVRSASLISPVGGSEGTTCTTQSWRSSICGIVVVLEGVFACFQRSPRGPWGCGQVRNVAAKRCEHPSHAPADPGRESTGRIRWWWILDAKRTTTPCLQDVVFRVKINIKDIACYPTQPALSKPQTGAV